MNGIDYPQVRKKIVFTSNTSYSLYNFRLGLMSALKKKGFEIFFVAPLDEYTEILGENFRYFILKHLDRKGKNPLKDLKLFSEYLYYYRKLKPDVVINYTIKPNIYSSIACGLLKIPCISVVTGLGYVYQKGGFLKFLVNCLYRLSFYFSNKVVILNVEDLKELRKIIPERKLFLINGEGVNTDFFSPEKCKDNMKEKPKDKTIFLYFGRFLKDKGIFEIVEAGIVLWKERKDFEIWFVGALDKGNPKSLNEEDLEHFKNLSFVRLFPFTKDVRTYLCESDVVVYPSYYREGIPRALLEAMSMQKPIITSDAPGCRETVFEERNGFLVKPKDVESLYKAMKRFMNLSEDKRRKMGKEGLKLALEKFDEKIVISKYLKLVEDVILQ